MIVDGAGKAVVLAAGRGTRMRCAVSGLNLTDAQRQAAAAGGKAMMPFDQPFLDYVLTALADAGFTQVCLVVGRQATEMRRHYTQTRPPQRIKLCWAEEAEPLGTAHALLAAREFAGDDLFAVINADNYYPVDALRQLRSLRQCGLIGFNRDVMIRMGSASAERIADYAVLQHDGTGNLQAIIEKPTHAQVSAMSPPILLSMNCWLFTPEIFDACRRIAPSIRGEYELPAAVMYGIRQQNIPFRMLVSQEPVWDLSRQTDIPGIARLLAGREVRL